MKHLVYLFIFFFILFSCREKNSNYPSYHYNLIELPDKSLQFPIDENTEFVFSVLFPYTDKSGKEYLTFRSRRNNSILFYELRTGNFLFDVKLQKEGPNGVGNMNGYYVEDFNNIYIFSYEKNGIIKVDTDSTIKQYIPYRNTTNGYSVVQSFTPSSLVYNPMFLIDDKIYITQKPYQLSKIADTPVSVIIDTVNNIINEHTFRFPPLIKENDMNHYLIDFSFSRDFNGTHFIYSFEMDENIYITDNQSNEIKKINIKSKYIPKLLFEKLPDNIETSSKLMLETSRYQNVLYDKYRNVYYRFTIIGTDINNYKPSTSGELWRSGPLRFSIIILDKNFNIIGETLFPAATYNSRIAFVHKDGLYISDSHFLNPSFDENILSFKCFTINKIK